MNRVVVIGSSCSGKSTFSKRLSSIINVEHIELDQLHWLPDWQERSDEQFRELVNKATLANAWIVDGNYSVTRDIVWPQATTIVWLNHSFSLVLFRCITRSILRVVTRKKLFSGNIESLKQTFLSRNSIILWVLKTYHQKQKNYALLLKNLENKGVNVIEFKKQSQVNAFLRTVDVP